MRRLLQSVLPFLFVLQLGVVADSLLAQSWVSQVQQNGFTLKKVVSDTAIATGQTFAYTIYYSFPAGATAISITDVLPPSVVFHSISVTSPCGPPTVSTPTVGTTGTVQLQWASAPTGCSGSFVITVSFPNGITCNGTAARNRACLSGNIGPLKTDICTDFLSTRAIAVDPWNIGKWALGVGSQPGPCGSITADSIITYQICVYKNVGTTGQLNLVNSVVYDTLPAGATLVSSSCSAIQTGNVIQWTTGALSALPMYNTQCCTFQILYPRLLFPVGTQITNRATLTGTLGSANAPCGPASHTSNQTCVEIKPFTSATFSKYVYTNGQPGCSGKYQIWICNNGSLPINSLTVTDTIPSLFTGVALGTVSAGLNGSLTGNIVTVTLSSPLLPTQCRYFEVNFTIPPTAVPNSVITNCAWLTYGTPTTTLQACASFTVNAPAPKPCLWKEVCNKQASYKPGDTVRYRLRVQNIGGQPITGATITDVLNPNLQFLGNVSSYTGTAWNIPCQSSTSWPVSVTTSGNTVTINLPSIPATCQNIFYNNCGMYGTPGVPYYWIEFDVKIADTSALGNIPNMFAIGGGTVTVPVNSNIDYVNVVGTAGFILDKGVAKDTTSWAASTTAAAGSNVNYRLRLQVVPGSVGLRHITFADLLPRDNGTNDQLILGPCSPRGSSYDIAYVAPILTSPVATGYSNPLSFARINNFAPAGAPGAMFIGSCGTAGTWSPGIAAGNKNPGYYFGSTPVPAGSSARAVFSASIPSSAVPPDVACNTFAANAAVRHLINSTIVSDQKIGELESQKACVTVLKDTTGDCFTVQPQSITPAGLDTAGNCTYTVVLSVTNPTASALTGWFDSFQGTVSPATLSLPTGVSTQTLTFTDTPPSDIFICIRFGIMDAVGLRTVCDSVCFDIKPCSSDPCDSLHVSVTSVTSTGTGPNGQCTYSVVVSATNSGVTPIPTWFDSFQGAVSPSGITIPPGTSTQTLTFTDTPPADTLVCIRFGILVNGQKKVCDSICFTIKPCSSDPCDSLSVGFGSVTSTGTNSSGYCTYNVVLTTTNAGASPVSTWFESFQGTVAPALVTIPPGTSSQTFSFTDLPPQNSIVCFRYGIFVSGQKRLCDSLCFDIPPCPTKPCDSLVKPSLDECCEYSVTIANGPGTPITSISYSISGGTVNSIITTPCTPVSPALPGSTSGTLVYSPPCPGNMTFSIDATPNTPSNLIIVTLVVHHGQKDSCVLRFQYECDPTPLVRCDSIRVKPFHYQGMKYSGRTFNVFNVKSPASPITWIDVIPTPTPCLMVGSGLQVDFVSTPWSPPYLRIPLSGTILAFTKVQFNLGIAYSCGWTGTIKVVVHHADGDSCTYTYGPWNAKPPIIHTDIDLTRLTGRIYANRLQLRNTGQQPVKWVSISTEDSTDMIVAGSGARWEGAPLEAGYERLDEYLQSRDDALFGFEQPVGPSRSSGFFNIVVARDSIHTDPPILRWITYDADGNALSTDTIRITTPVISAIGEGGSFAPQGIELLHFFPNPSSGSATINYLLGRNMTVKLELFNQLGERIAEMDAGQRSEGLHTFRYHTAGLAPGTYHVRLTGENGGMVNKPLVIVR